MIKTTSALMRQVIYALLPGIAVYFYCYGWGIIIQISLALCSALSCEYIMLKLRKKDNRFIQTSMADGSAIITALLLSLSIPSIAPWWIIVIGIVFAIVFGKHLYGGLGNNPFNPAMLGYAFLLISYPLPMTQWQGVLFMPLAETLNIIFSTNTIDAISAATQLETLKTSYSAAFFLNIAFLAGGIYLLLRNIIKWHIPCAFLVSIIIFSALFKQFDETLLAASFHLLTGATMLAAFFIATDPVSASTTAKGRIIYGFIIGFLVMLIRSFGSYPDGVAFAVLLANITVPLIDYYTQPKILGEKNE